ncbi:gamma carbonic anhydrase family protein [Ferrovibrio sp.]|uniref:gamma carbonic anhydrase family protein n=1 Tax=Ferrovibrio sp. TaxID=1917215 RepID=UPI0025BE8256|nr:gamma carbonic anhydrase family protein [Ferrovibrio sp.]MBX3456670.1 gamma carbonic anhydrase family protein [Ferrovibrio sp.]
MKPLVLPFDGKQPVIAPDAFIAPNATVIGDVEIGAGASIWFNTVLRGDVHFIRIGARTNIQDGSVVHVTTGRFPTIVGDDVLVGHMVLLHGCTVESNSFVGMGAIVMDEAVIESRGMLAAGALLTPGKRVRSGQLWGGRPAKFLRDLTPEEVENLADGPQHYVELARKYRGNPSD